MKSFINCVFQAERSSEVPLYCRICGVGSRDILPHQPMAWLRSNVGRGLAKLENMDNSILPILATVCRNKPRSSWWLASFSLYILLFTFWKTLLMKKKRFESWHEQIKLLLWALLHTFVSCGLATRILNKWKCLR